VCLYIGYIMNFLVLFNGLISLDLLLIGELEIPHSLFLLSMIAYNIFVKRKDLFQRFQYSSLSVWYVKPMQHGSSFTFFWQPNKK
jgi:hypothetical protein